MIQTVFNRCEKKYLISRNQYNGLLDKIKDRMVEDEYGEHTVSNIYYDTHDNLLIRRSIEKPPYKEKLRLRSYGIPNPESTVFIEIKKKYAGIVNKRRISLPLEDAYAYLNDGIRPEMDSQILREIDFLLGRVKLLPALYLAYDRVAYLDREEPDFRLTFDKNIRSRRDHVNLENGDRGELLLDMDTFLMESKILGSVPLWFSAILAELKIYPASFSKYGSIYQKETLRNQKLSIYNYGACFVPGYRIEGLSNGVT